MNHRLALITFFCSGCAGLIYETCWIRKSSLVFGSTTFAVSTVLAVFFFGLAVGSFLIGRWAQRARQPIRWFGILEIAVGLLAWLTLPAFDLLDSIYGAAYRRWAGQAEVLFAVRFILVALVLLPPTILMGGTLPLFCRQYVRDRDRIARGVGFLYAMNTLGAAAGCSLAGFVLLPWLGSSVAILAGGSLSVLAGLIALRLPIASAAEAKESAPAKRPRTPAIAFSPRVVGALFFSMGLAALGSEVLWARFLGLLVRNTVYTYTITLTMVLLGIVLGSALAGLWFDRSRQRLAQVFAISNFLIACTTVLLMTLPAQFWAPWRDQIWIYALVLLPGAILSGASFPLAIRMVLDQPGSAPATVGLMTALNTAGGIVGSLLVGFLLLPKLGIERTLHLLTGLSLATGAVAWLQLAANPGRLLRWGVMVGVTALWALTPGMTGTRVPADLLADGGTLLGYREGLNSNLAVIQKEHARQLEIDRLWQGEDRKNHQALVAHIPMLLHPGAKSAIVVGAGTGQTPSRFLMYDIERLDCVDIEPAVFDVIRDYFEAGWMNDPRVRLLPEDGRNHLAHTSQRYDVISIEVGQIFRPGVPFFYTKEFYERARSRLNDGGYLSQFLPVPFFTPGEFAGAIHTFLEVFPHSILWYNTSELLLIGCNADEFRLDPHRLSLLERDGKIRADLAYAHWGSEANQLQRPEAFLSGFLMTEKGLHSIASGGTVYHDVRPILDYATYDLEESLVHETPIAELLRGHLEPLGELGVFADVDVAEVGRLQRRNVDDILAQGMIRRASALIPIGRIAEIEALLRDAHRLNPDNFDANRMLAEIRMSAGDLAAALSLYETAIQVRTDETIARRGLAAALLQSGRAMEAIPHLRAVLAVNPRDAQAHNNLGVALTQQDDFNEALLHFEEAVRLNPEYADARQNSARLRGALQDTVSTP
jgi:spermidine synthase